MLYTFAILENSHFNSAVHEGMRSHECSICGKRFTNKRNLKIHTLSVHEGKKSHTCNICNKNFVTFSILNQHDASIHKGMKPHKCSICDKSFSQKGNLNRHFAVHEPKPHAYQKSEDSN